MILSDNETRIDRLNNLAIAKTIVSIIKESKESVSVGVHGDWGAGKSSILAMVEDELSTINESSDNKEKNVEYVAIRFNSWQYQGFEDAKIALMSAIVSQLEKTAEIYCYKHKIETGIKEVQEIGKRLWKNLDKLSVAKSIGKIGVSIATGTAPLVLIGGIIEAIKDTVTDQDKVGELIETIGNMIQAPSEEASGYKEMEEFRKALRLEKRTVVVMDENDQNVILASRNLPTLSTLSVGEINTYEIVKNAVVVLTKGSVKKIEEAYAL